MKLIKKLLLLVLLFIASIFLLHTYTTEDGEGFSIKTLATQKSVAKNGLYSQNIILENLDTKEVLYEKRKNEQIAIASLTKMMTAYILLNEVSDLDTFLTVDPNVINDLVEQGASLSGFSANDQVSVRDLAYAILLPSGGDAAIIVANWLAESEENFAKKMNAYASELKMENTQFKNATGLDQKGHYSTVNDLRLLLNKALTNENFYHIFTTFEYQTQPRTFAPGGYYLPSTLLKGNNDLTLTQGTILGGKTGYTKNAGLCLASIANIDGQRYLLISAGADGDPQTEQYNLSDAKTIFNQLN